MTTATSSQQSHQKLPETHNKKKNSYWIELVISAIITAGIYFFMSLGKYIEILPIITLFASAIMIIELLKSTEGNRKIIFSTITLGLVYALLFLKISKYDQGNINFNTVYLLSIMVISWVLGLLPFFWKKNHFTLTGDWKNYFFLTTSLMWLSPLITEITIWLSWYTNGTFAEKTIDCVLGYNGFNDFLFILGFETMIFSGLVAILLPKIANWLTIKRNTE
jgi:hypothetical protein